jgi:hypothetical protein
MLKKIQNFKEAEALKSGDIIYDDPMVEIARDFKIKLIFNRHMLIFHGGDFPSIKIIHKKELFAGNWWVMI